MDAFPEMFQNTFFIVEQQVTHIAGGYCVILGSPTGKSIHYFIL